MSAGMRRATNMRNDYELDPERLLWRPGRRSFLFLIGAATASLLLENQVVAATRMPGKLYVIRGKGFAIASDGLLRESPFGPPHDISEIVLADSPLGKNLAQYCTWPKSWSMLAQEHYFREVTEIAELN